MSYRWEKLFTAVDSLIGRGDMKERLLNAYVYSLIHLNERYFPEEELKKKFIEIKEELNRIPAVGDEGTAWATIKRLSEDEAVEYAHKILSLFDSVCEIDYKNQTT